MNEYRIEKLRRHVHVVLNGGQQLDGEVFVQPMARFRTGPEHPLDLFNEAEPFFALSRSPADVLLVAKDQVCHVETAAPTLDSAYETPHVGVHVMITLADGSASTGYVFPETRVDRARLLDFLNTYAQRFLAVFTADVVRLVNRRLIVHVRELD